MSTNTPTSWKWAYRTATVGWTQFATTQNPTFTFPAGTYDINLTATNAGGSDDEIKTGHMTVSQAVPAPVANFIAAPQTGTGPLSVTFTDTSTNTPTSWVWNFGDGSTSTEQNPIHSYTKTGRYTVKLTVTNAGGSNTITKKNYIIVTRR